MAKMKSKKPRKTRSDKGKKRGKYKVKSKSSALGVRG